MCFKIKLHVGWERLYLIKHRKENLKSELCTYIFKLRLFHVLKKMEGSFYLTRREYLILLKWDTDLPLSATYTQILFLCKLYQI